MSFTVNKKDEGKMKRIMLLCLLTFFSLGTIAQIRSNDLNGTWTTNNLDSLYFKSDTLKLYQLTIENEGELACPNIQWIINKKEFNIHYINLCTDKPSIMNHDVYGTIHLKNNKINQTVEIKRRRQILDSFEVLSLENLAGDSPESAKKILTLVRIDDNNTVNASSNGMDTDCPQIWHIGYLMQFF